MPYYTILTPEGQKVSVNTDDMRNSTGGTLDDQVRISARLAELENGRFLKEGKRVPLIHGRAIVTEVSS